MHLPQVNREKDIEREVFCFTALSVAKIIELCCHMHVNETRVRSNGVMTLTGGDRNTRTKSYPTATLSTMNPTQTGPTQNSGLGGEKPETIRQSHGTVMRIARSSIKNRRHELHAAHDIVITNCCRSYWFWGSQYWEEFRPNNDIRTLQRSDLVACRTTQKLLMRLSRTECLTVTLYLHMSMNKHRICVWVYKEGMMGWGHMLRTA